MDQKCSEGPDMALLELNPPTEPVRPPPEEELPSFDVVTEEDVQKAAEEDLKQKDESYDRLADLQSRLSAASEKGQITEEEAALIQLVELRSRFLEWSFARKETIEKLREIADYIEQVSRRATVTKVVGSGGGAVGGALTVVGGALSLFATAATGGLAAVPILIAGTSIGLASGLAGGAASITEKIVKSKQMGEAQEAIKKDKEATELLEDRLEHLQHNAVARKVATKALVSGGSAVKDSLSIFSLVTSGVGGAGGGVTEGIGKISVEVIGKVFGDEFGQEISKLVLHTTGRVVTGTVTVVLGGATMIYDIYRLSAGLDEMARGGKDGAADKHLREIADQLEKALVELQPKKDDDEGDEETDEDDDESQETEKQS